MGKLRQSEDIDRAWEKIKEDIKTSAKESLVLQKLKKNKSVFDDECSLFFRRKHAKLQ
jgi:hypothetical protein